MTETAGEDRAHGLEDATPETMPDTITIVSDQGVNLVNLVGWMCVSLAASCVVGFAAMAAGGSLSETIGMVISGIVVLNIPTAAVIGHILWMRAVRPRRQTTP